MKATINLVIMLSILLLSPVTRGGTISVDWDVDLELSHEQFSGMGISDDWTPSFGFDFPGADGRIGVSFEVENTKPTYKLNLPYEFTITAPDTAAAGELVKLNVDFGFRSAPSFTAETDIVFDTSLQVKTSGLLLPDIDRTIQLPNEISSSGINAILGGTDSDFTSTNSYTQSSVGNGFEEDPYGKVVTTKTLSPTGDIVETPISGLSRFQGTTLTTPFEQDSGSDGWSAAFDLMSLIPPPPGPVIDAFVDLNVGIGLDPKEKARLANGMLAASYADYVVKADGTVDFLSGASSIVDDEYDYIVFNHRDFAPSLEVSNQVQVGDDYRVQIGGLMTNFNVISEIFLQGVGFLDIRFDSNIPFVPDPSYRIFDFGIGGPVDIGSEFSHFLYFEFLNNFLSATDAASKFLQIEIVDLPAPSPEFDRFLPGEEFGPNRFIPDLGTEGGFGNLDFGGESPPELFVAVSVSEPPGLLLLLGGLLASVLLRFRGKDLVR